MEDKIVGIIPKINMFAYDPKLLSLKINGQKVYGFCSEYKFAFSLDNKVPLKFKLQITSDCVSKLLKLKDSIVSYEVDYDCEHTELWSKQLRALLDDGFGQGILKYTIKLGGEFPDVDFWIEGI